MFSRSAWSPRRSQLLPPVPRRAPIRTRSRSPCSATRRIWTRVSRRTPSSTRRRCSSTRSTTTRACRRSCTSATSIPAVSRAPTPTTSRSSLSGQAFQKPLIYTPGDNEWSDCTKAKEEPGSDNDNVVTHPDLPLENLALIRQIFFPEPGLDPRAVPACRCSLRRTGTTGASDRRAVRRERHVGAVEDRLRHGQPAGRLEQRHRSLVRENAHVAVESGSGRSRWTSAPAPTCAG